MLIVSVAQRTYNTRKLRTEGEVRKMSLKTKKLLAVLLVVITLFGWYITVFGIGSMNSIKDQLKFGLDINGGVNVVMEAQTDATGAELKSLMEQTQAVIENRVNQMGLSEPVVTIEGEKRIRIELPGAEDAKEAIDTIGRTAQLQFMMADGTVALDGSHIKTAKIATDSEHGGYAVSLEFTNEGTELFAEATRKAISGSVTPMTDELMPQMILIVLDGDIISSPVVQSVITNGNASITAGGTGGFSQEEATNLAALIRGGALPVSLTQVNTSIQTATIGENALQMSVIAGIIGLILVFAVMLIGYQMMGLAACVALALYVILDLWCMVALRAVLTLPGIAGIILSVGMAVDANVVIFTRIREEICSGKSVRVSINSGFKRAMSTVLDSQITTIIAAVVLYMVGTSAVKGFALTLMIGIVLSIFTAVVVTQLFVGILGESKRYSQKKYYGIKEDNTAKLALKRQFAFVKHRKIFYSVSVAIIVIGLLVGGIRGFNSGIDFTGGTMLQIDLGQQATSQQVEDVLKEYGITDAQIVFTGDTKEEVIIKTKTSLDSDARDELIKSMEASFGITDKNIMAVDQFGPSVGNELRVNAIKAVLIAALGMLIYVALRFEWKFGVAAVAGVFHDVLIVLAFYGLFHITINNPFIAGILTVVGYSINDTIVVFDRIRENLGIMKKGHLEELIDASINQTLSRSIMTSFTTLLVMIPMIVLAGTGIREFIVPLFIGVIAGCASSIFTCSQLYFDLSSLSGGSKYKAKKSKKNS